ncbi:MAG TPA: hypothetical protein VGP64_13035 [Polyangia bacterium]|jgi:hypothetical protein
MTRAHLIRAAHPTFGRRNRPTVGILVFAGLVTIAGCGQKLCEPQIDVNGAVYDVSIARVYGAGEVYNTVEGNVWNPSTTMYTPLCDGIDGLNVGAVLQFQTIGETTGEAPGCSQAVAELVAGPSGLTIDGRLSQLPTWGPDLRVSTDVMYALPNVTFGDCSGTLMLEFFDRPGDFFGVPANDGGYQPAVMYRLFYPSSGSCSLCNDNFVVQVSRHTGGASTGPTGNQG